MKNYKLGKSRFSVFHNCEVIDILKKEYFFIFSYWTHSDTIKNVGQAEEIVFLLNNPVEFKNRIITFVKNINDKNNHGNK